MFKKRLTMSVDELKLGVPAAVIGLALLSFAGSANAILISTLEDFTNGGGYFGQITIEDNGPNSVTVTGSVETPINQAPATGDIFGIFLNIDNPGDYSDKSAFSFTNANSVVTAFDYVPTGGITQTGNGGNNLNGGNPMAPSFNLGFQIGSKNGQNRLSSFTFDLMAIGLSESSFANQDTGMRVRDTSSAIYTVTSSKLLGSTGGTTPPTAVPLPGTLALLGAGFLGLGFSRKVRKTRS